MVMTTKISITQLRCRGHHYKFARPLWIDILEVDDWCRVQSDQPKAIGFGRNRKEAMASFKWDFKWNCQWLMDSRDIDLSPIEVEQKMLFSELFTEPLAVAN